MLKELFTCWKHMLVAPLLMKLKTYILNTNTNISPKMIIPYQDSDFERLSIEYESTTPWFLSFFFPCLTNERKHPTKATSGKTKLVQKWWYLISVFACLISQARNNIFCLSLIMSLRCCHKILWQYPDYVKLTIMIYGWCSCHHF